MHRTGAKGQWTRLPRCDTIAGLLPIIRKITEYFIFQQDSAPAHGAQVTVELLQTETPGFIPATLWPHNSPDLNPVDYKMWSVMQAEVNRYRINDVNELCHRIVEAWDEKWIKTSLMSLSSDGVCVFVHAWMPNG